MNAKTAKKAAVDQTVEQPSTVLQDETRNIRPLGKDEKAISKVIVDENANTVEAWYSLGTNRDINSPHQGVTTFDFSGCSRAELLDLASRGPLIAVQRRWSTIARSSGVEAASKPGQFARVDVKRDVIDSQRHSAPPSQKATKLIEKMSEEEKRALVARLEAELNGS